MPHHGTALIRADEALAKAVHPGLVAIAQKAKDDQGREIGQFKAERVRLFSSDSTPPPMVPEPIPSGPEEFDRMWLMMMIDHHQGAIDQSLLARDAGVTPLLDSLASHTIQEQRQSSSTSATPLKCGMAQPPQLQLSSSSSRCLPAVAVGRARLLPDGLAHTFCQQVGSTARPPS